MVVNELTDEHGATDATFERASSALDAEHVMQTYGRLPVAFVRGEGTKLWDSEGNEYLDFLGGLAVASLGHAHPAVADALAEQARTLLHVSNLYYNERAAAGRGAPRRAARRRRPGVLRQLGRRGQRVRDQARPPLRPGERRPRALPRALRVRLVPRPHAHHARRHRPAAEAGDVPAAARRASARSAFGDLDALRGGDGRAGVRGDARADPGRGRREPGAARLPRGGARAVRRARGAARSSTRCRPGSAAPGKWFGFQHADGVRPDIVTMAKALGNGVPDRRVLGARRGGRRVQARRPRHHLRRAAARRPRRADGARGDGGRGRARRCADARRRAAHQGAARRCPGVADGARRGPAARRRARRRRSSRRTVATACLRRRAGGQRGHADRVAVRAVAARHRRRDRRRGRDPRATCSRSDARA